MIKNWCVHTLLMLVQTHSCMHTCCFHSEFCAIPKHTPQFKICTLTERHVGIDYLSLNVQCKFAYMHAHAQTQTIQFDLYIIALFGAYNYKRQNSFHYCTNVIVTALVKAAAAAAVDPLSLNDWTCYYFNPINNRFASHSVSDRRGRHSIIAKTNGMQTATMLNIDCVQHHNLTATPSTAAAAAATTTINKKIW